MHNISAQHQNKLLHTEFQIRRLEQGASDATTAAATMITQGVLPVVRIKLVNGNHSLSVQEICDTGYLISFVDKSIVSTRQLQGQRACSSVAGIHGSQIVKTDIVPISASAHKKSRPVTTVQLYVHQKQKLGDQIVEQQGLKDRYPHLSTLPNQSYNLNEIQIIVGHDCYDIHQLIEFEKSDAKTAPWAVKLKIRWALSGHLPAKQAATIATTATSVLKDKLASY